MNLPLARIGVALFPAKESHRRLIFDVLRAINGCNRLVGGTNSVTGTHVLENVSEIAASRQILRAHRRSTLHATEPALSGGPLVYSDTGTSSDVVGSFVDESM